MSGSSTGWAATRPPSGQVRPRAAIVSATIGNGIQRPRLPIEWAIATMTEWYAESAGLVACSNPRSRTRIAQEGTMPEEPGRSEETGFRQDSTFKRHGPEPPEN